MVKLMTAAVAMIGLMGAALAQSVSPNSQGPSVIWAGQLLANPATGRVEREQTILIDAQGRIERIVPGYQPAGEARLIDLRNQFVLPGLIDSHVHILWETGATGRLDAVTMSEADYAMSGAFYARRTLEAGFTTVVDLGAGAGGDAIYALRDSIAAGRTMGPRILAAGSTITPHGGHADVHGYSEAVTAALARRSVCSGADDCRRAVREQIRDGADVIKITATGGVLSNTAAGLNQQFTDAEMVAIVETAHSLGRRVTAHAHGKDGIDAALRAGVDSIEHGTYLDAESIRLFRQNNAALVPTALAGAHVAEEAAQPNTWMTPAQQVKARTVGPLMAAMVRRAHEGGVRIVFGTDSGVSPHGQNGREFGILVEAGLTPLEAIQSATTVGATHNRLQDETGRIEPGLAADIIAVAQDPTRDISQLRQIRFVMARGRVAKGG